MTRYGITEDYDYNATHRRHRLDLWSGPFRDQHEGHALSTSTGYTVWPTYGDKYRVTCPSPRNEDNYQTVDAALNRALRLAEAEGLERAADKWEGQAERLEREALDPLSGRSPRDAELAEASRAEAAARRAEADQLRKRAEADRLAEGWAV